MIEEFVYYVNKQIFLELSNSDIQYLWNISMESLYVFSQFQISLS